jgi:hypothetical protein
MRPIETNGAKLEIFAGPDLRFGKEGIFWSEAFSLAQQGDPFDEDVSEVFADWEKPGRKGLRALRSYVARVLFDQFVLNVDMLQLEGDDCPIPGAREECERD